MLASFCGHADVVKTIFETTKAKELLLDVDSEGWTPLFYATAMGHDQVVERKDLNKLLPDFSSRAAAAVSPFDRVESVS